MTIVWLYSSFAVNVHVQETHCIYKWISVNDMEFANLNLYKNNLSLNSFTIEFSFKLVC